jgi:hypothetical protein
MFLFFVGTNRARSLTKEKKGLRSFTACDAKSKSPPELAGLGVIQDVGPDRPGHWLRHHSNRIQGVETSAAPRPYKPCQTANRHFILIFLLLCTPALAHDPSHPELWLMIGRSNPFPSDSRGA